MEYAHIKHGFQPVYDENSRVLILGSLPSVKSREQQFFYGHPQNRFWKVLAAVTGDELPGTVEEKRGFLLRNRIALYDTIYECDIAGSSDASIRNVVPTDLSPILNIAPIAAVFTNGAASSRTYKKYHLPVTGIEAVSLPSTSPANAAWSLDRLTGIWAEELRKYL